MLPPISIDLNADLGEGGAEGFAHDAALLVLVSSANIACGGHAGDENTMRATVAEALRRGVALGAHPSHPDREHFGRRALQRSPAEVFADVSAQVLALHAIAQDLGGVLHHVKPHGALYNQAAADPALADAIAAAVRYVDPQLRLMGLAGSELVHAARRHGLNPIAEAFADRAYQANGQLVPRGTPGAVIEDVSQALQQVKHLLHEGRVQTIDGHWLPLRAFSLCVHGDGAQALALLQALRQALDAWGIYVTRPGPSATKMNTSYR